MPNYLVSWVIDIDDAANAEDAARKARAIQVRPDSTANVFSVQRKGATGSLESAVDVDLQELDSLKEDDGW